MSWVSRDVLWYIPQGASADTIFFQWSQCTDSYVLPDGGASLPPAFIVLPNVIEEMNQSVVIGQLSVRLEVSLNVCQ